MLIFLLLLTFIRTTTQQSVKETISGKAGGYVALKCGFDGVQWFKTDENGKLVAVKDLGDRRYKELDDGTMYISRLKTKDAAIYTCTKLGYDIRVVTVVIAAKPSVVISPSDVTTRPGALVHLPCEGSGDPQPTVEWTVGRSSVNNAPVISDNLSEEEILNYSGDDKFLVTESGHLYIRDVTVHYTGQYVCLWTNYGGTTWATANVLVLDPPRITSSPTDMTVVDVDVIGFACRAVGNPRPKITWRIETDEGIVITDVRNNDRYHTDIYKALRIRYPVPSDNGNYTCIATNAGGVAEVSASLQVLLTPQFRIPPKDAWVPFGNGAVFSCTIFGSPTPVIEWFKDSEYLPFSNTYRIRHVTRPNEVQEELIFAQVQFEDTGFYECRGSNAAGTARHEFSMAVTDGTPFPGDRFVKDALEYAQTFVKSAVQETQVALSARFNDPNFQPTPQDLFHLVRQPTRQTLYMAMSAEVFEHALDYIHQEIEALNATSLERNQQPLGSLLSPSAIDHLEDLSGCHLRKRMPKCDMRCQQMSFRTHDGTCNNVKNPLWGSGLHSMNRFLPALYENKYNTPRGWSHDLPSARMISQRLIRTHTTSTHSKFNILMMHFGQFIDHDMAQTVEGPSETSFAPFLRVRCEQTCSNTMPCFPIEISTNDSRIDAQCMPFVRSAATCGTGDTSVFGKEIRVREQLNQVTAFVDASHIYGSADEDMETLRDRSANKGQLRVGREFMPGKHFLPVEDSLIPEELESQRRCIGRASTVFVDCFIAGDFRATEQPGLTTLHTLFMRQHNHVAYKLADINPQWNDDRVYEEARKIIGAIMQHITYTEYLPKVLGIGGMELLESYRGYDADTDPSLLNEFATAAFRFGHTLIPPTMFRRGENFEEFELGDMSLHNSFFTPYRLTDEGGLDPIIRGMLMQNLKLPDGKVTDALTERLFHIVAQVSLDLAAINIQRGRDHAIPTYNDMRSVCGMRRAINFHDLQSEIRNSTTRQLLSELYASVDDIDLWVGGLEEDVAEGALVGPTFRCIIAEQFKRVRDGDRFWHEADKHFTPEQLRQIKKVTMATVFCESGDNITTVPEDVFLYNPDAHRYTHCRDLPKFDFSVFMDCGGPDYLKYDSYLHENTRQQSVTGTDGHTLGSTGTYASSFGTSAAPGSSSAAPGGSTAAPGGSTAAPGGSTAAPGGSTAAPGGSTAAPSGLTVGTRGVVTGTVVTEPTNEMITTVGVDTTVVQNADNNAAEVSNLEPGKHTEMNETLESEHTIDANFNQMDGKMLDQSMYVKTSIMDEIMKNEVDGSPMAIRVDLDVLRRNLNIINVQLEQMKSQVAVLEKMMLVEGGCIQDDEVYEQGQQWYRDVCTYCTCQAGKVSCAPNPACAQLTL